MCVCVSKYACITRCRYVCQHRLYVRACVHVCISSGSRGWVRGGPRNMKAMRLPLGAIFFMTNYYRAGGAWPLPAPHLLLVYVCMCGVCACMCACTTWCWHVSQHGVYVHGCMYVCITWSLCLCMRVLGVRVCMSVGACMCVLPGVCVYVCVY